MSDNNSPTTTVTDEGADPAPENDILAEARRIRELAESAAAKVDWKKAAGIGIGSAAIIAAALYASRKRD